MSWMDENSDVVEQIELLTKNSGVTVSFFHDKHNRCVRCMLGGLLSNKSAASIEGNGHSLKTAWSNALMRAVWVVENDIAEAEKEKEWEKKYGDDVDDDE